jgi:head-tail adaptor
MNAGLMDVLITIQSPTYADNAYGKGVKPTSWSDNGTFWGRVTYNGGGESTAADKKEYRETVSIQAHYIDTSSIALTERLSFDDRYWNITSKAQIGRNQYIRLEAVAVD